MTSWLGFRSACSWGGAHPARRLGFFGRLWTTVSGFESLPPSHNVFKNELQPEGVCLESLTLTPLSHSLPLVEFQTIPRISPRLEPSIRLVSGATPFTKHDVEVMLARFDQRRAAPPTRSPSRPVASISDFFRGVLCKCSACSCGAQSRRSICPSVQRSGRGFAGGIAKSGSLITRRRADGVVRRIPATLSTPSAGFSPSKGVMR